MDLSIDRCRWTSWSELRTYYSGRADANFFINFFIDLSKRINLSSQYHELKSKATRFNYIMSGLKPRRFVTIKELETIYYLLNAIKKLLDDEAPNADNIELIRLRIANYYSNILLPKLRRKDIDKVLMVEHYLQNENLTTLSLMDIVESFACNQDECRKIIMSPKMIEKLLIKSEAYRIEDQLTYSCLYMILTSVPGIQRQLFSTSQIPVSHINSFFKEAVKISPYIRKNKVNQARVDYLRRRFNLPYLSLSDESLYEQFVFVILNEVDDHNIVVIETTGLDNYSISYLIRFCYDFLSINRDKLIILIQREHQRVKFPDYLLLEIDEAKVEDAIGWLTELDSKYLK